MILEGCLLVCPSLYSKEADRIVRSLEMKKIFRISKKAALLDLRHARRLSKSRDI